MYICIYTHTYIYIYTCMYTHIDICIYTYKYLYIHTWFEKRKGLMQVQCGEELSMPYLHRSISAISTCY